MHSPSKDSIECHRANSVRVKSEVMVPGEVGAPDELLAEAERQEMVNKDDTIQLLPNQKKKDQSTEDGAPNQTAFVNQYQGRNITEDRADALETIIAVSPVESKLYGQNGKLVQDELMTKELDTQRTPDMLEQVGLNCASSKKEMHDDESLYEGRSSKNESYTAVEKSMDTQPKTQDESNINVDEAAANPNSREKDVDNSGELSSVVVNTNGSQRKQKTLPAVPSPVALFEDIETEPSQMSLTNKSSLFAQEIDDDSTVDCDSNTQSYLDLPDHLTDTDLDGDTDTESVRREFFQEARRIKDLLGQQQHEGSEETVRHKLRRNTASSVSSQASIDIPDKIPVHKREEVKRRRAVLLCIFSFLDTWNLTRVAQVCREWRIVTRSPKLWKRVELRGRKVSSQFLKQIARRCSELRVLVLEDLYARGRRKSESMEEYHKDLKCSLELGVECILKKAEATLHTIVIVNCGTLLSAKCLWIASCCCRMLKHVTYLSDFDPVNSEVMWALGSGCRDLQTLKCQPILPCSNAEKFTTRCVQMIGKCFLDLTYLSVGGLNIDPTALIFTAKQCQKLSYLEVHHMQFITCDVIDAMCQEGLHSLRSFQFHSTPVAPGALTVLHGSCKGLVNAFVHFMEEDYENSKPGLDKSVAVPEYQELVDGYEVLQQQRDLAKILDIRVERPSAKTLELKQQADEPKKERSFFERWFK